MSWTTGSYIFFLGLGFCSVALGGVLWGAESEEGGPSRIARIFAIIFLIIGIFVTSIPFTFDAPEIPEKYHEEDAKIPIVAIKCTEDGVYIWVSEEYIWYNEDRRSFYRGSYIISYSHINPIFDVESVDEAYLIADVEEYGNQLCIVWDGWEYITIHIPKDVWYD